MHFFNLAAGYLAVASSIVLAAPVAEAGPLLPSPVEKRATAAGSLTAIVAVTPMAGVSGGDVTINGKTVSVIYDTGSSGLWIYGNGNGPNFTQSYVGGTVYGNVAYGDVTIGGITVKNQAYGLVYKTTSNNGQSFGSGGIMGLGLAQTVYNGAGPSWLSQAIPQLQAPILSINIPSSGAGTFAFGTTESAHMGGSPVWVPYDQAASYVRVSVSSFGMGANDASAVCSVDTGTTCIYTPSSVTTGFWSQVGGAYQDTSATAGYTKYLFPCSSTTSASSIPPWSVTIGGNTLSNPGKYLRATVDPSADKCGGLLQGHSPCILGQKFFHSWYTIVDFGSKKVGFAPRV